MKKKLLGLIASLLVFSSVAATGSSLAWILQTASVEGPAGERLPIESSSKSGYFAYGNGSSSKPYGIRTPRQLYNLAWLQYLGYFNDETGSQYYFELANNLDMTGWVLPPIGTEADPFIGNFNGKGYGVYNLTVSNSFTDMGDKHPIVVTQNNFVSPHILGFFGVVGDYNSEYVSTDEDEPEYEYSSATNEFKNTALSGLTIKTVLADSLVGVAAGYVDGGMSNVIVDSSNINIAYTGTGDTKVYKSFDNISDYYLVGYTTHKTDVTKGDKTLYAVNVSNHEFNATESGEDNGWGGSIDMMSMYQRLLNIKRNGATTVNNFVYRTTNNYLDNTLDNSIQEVAQSGNGYHPDDVSGSVSSNKYGQQRYAYNTNANHSYIGNYNFYARTATDNFTYLMGGTFTQDNYLKSSNSTTFKITDGTNYLRFNTSLQNTTTASSGTNWSFSSKTSGTISTTSGGNTVYLRNNSGTLTTTTTATQATTWTFHHSDDGLRIVSGTYEIAYVNAAWRLITASTDKHCTISSGTNYISRNSRNGNTPTNTTTANDAAVWYIERNTGYVYYFNGTTKMYLSMYVNGYYNTNLRVINNLTTNRYCYFVYNGGNLYARFVYDNGNYSGFLRYNSGWTYTTTSTSGIKPSISYLNDGFVNSSATTRSGKMSFTSLDTTYFPLNVAKDGSTTASYITNGNYDPKDTNTGYVVAGSIMDSTNIYGLNSSSIRVSQYAINNNISNSYYSSSIHNNKVYTITGDGVELLTDAYSDPEKDLIKYADSKKALQTVLQSSTNVYGLHFVSSPSVDTDISISKDNIVNASNISVQGNTYDNLQLPVYSIDFNLKEKGYINFFAGSYYSSEVTCFFSLHQVIRNNDAVLKTGSKTDYTHGGTISKIKEIQSIYSSENHNNWSYIYEYKDGTFSKPYRFTGKGDKYELTADGTGTTPYEANYDLTSISTYTSSTYGYAKIFDTNWITNFSGDTEIEELPQNYLYYFEIPMNDGEFCLGNVTGGDGGYLVYLDIAANAAKIQRTIFYETYKTNINVYSYPDGVCLQDIASYNSDASATPIIDISKVADASDTACIAIKAKYKGVLSADRNNSDVTLTRTNGTNAPPVFAGDKITLIHDANSTQSIAITPVESTSYLVKRMQYYDYVVNTDTLMVTTITDTSTDSGSSFTRTITQSHFNGRDPSTTPTENYDYKNVDDRDNIKIYNTTTGTRYLTTEINNQSVLTISSLNLSTSVILKFDFVITDGTYVDTTTLVAVLNQDSSAGTYYVFDQYTITVEKANSDIVITVTSHNSNYAIFINTIEVQELGANQTQTITIEP